MKIFKHTPAGDVFMTMSMIATLSASARFLLEGLSFTFAEHSLTFSHIDATTYGAFLLPILGAHGYTYAAKPPVGASDKLETP